MRGRIWDFWIDSYRARIQYLRSLSLRGVAVQFVLFPLSLFGTILFAFAASKSPYSEIALPKDYPESIRTDESEWPDRVKTEGIGRVEDYAVAYAEQGFFAVFRDGALQHMLFAPCDECGIVGDRIYTVYNDTLRLYDPQGVLVKTTDANALQRQRIDTGKQASVPPYVYRVTRKGGYDTITAKTDEETATLFSHRYTDPTVYVVFAVVCGVICVSCLIFSIVKALPYRLEVLRKYDIID